jgi:hypothetical protein
MTGRTSPTSCTRCWSRGFEQPNNHAGKTTVTMSWMGVLKKDAPASMVGAIDDIEARADECYKSLALLQLPSNLAVWALLLGAIQMVEQEIKEWSDDSPQLSATLINLSRLVPIAMKWAREHGQPDSSSADLSWTPQLDATVNEALNLASQYSHFVTCFPMWHRDRYSAQLLSPDVVRFTAPGTGRNRQVSAYLKGFRPKEGSFKAIAAKRQKQPEVIETLFALSLQGALMTGYRSFKYNDPWTLWRELLPEYQGRVNAMSRRNDMLSVGDYTLADFKQFYAAFLAVCAGHEFLCYTWGQERGLYPLGSAVMTRSHGDWATLLSEVSGLTSQKCQSIISDLSFNPAHSVDLHVSPFVPLRPAGVLAVAPQFPLHSQVEENILRVCSIRRPAIYQAMSEAKEHDMILGLKNRLPNRDIECPVMMPQPVPDIDALIIEESSSTVVIAELKWSRKSLLPKEIPGKDQEVLKGISQLDKIRTYLVNNPKHLKIQKKIARDFNEYEHVYYLVIPRDHWPWSEPADGIAIVEFEAFLKAMEKPNDLLSTIRVLLTYEWLPVEGRDFTVRYERATVNGVSNESEIFYSM